ncbi:hypothetical protein [Hymenobacter metallilatus]|uniref:Uncharacterized protein n=1 Tax=Hymenobacter metallilatus TaxID=2493666 RepID=A0A428JD87_9BACT|nr:hypothetical protein [Hymenobacter metallilatus]RSK30101.1 hypothetical protein EI290_14690 [Hymenobacter metallilatus]
MKQTVLTASLLIALVAAQATPTSRPAPRKVGKLSKLTKLSSRETAELSTRSLQLTCYLTDILRLSGKQAAEVRRATLLELQQGGQDSKQAATTYNAALLRILTSGQYSTFRWLEERQPVANLLQSPFTIEPARQ